MSLAACTILLALVPPSDPALRGCDWLVAHQAADGSFATNEPGAAFREGITALAALALLRGTTPAHATAAERALRHLARTDQVAAETTDTYVLACSAWALAEGVARWRAELATPAAATVRTLLARQQADGGWGYPPFTTRTETCVAALVLQALHAARTAGLEVPDAPVERGLAFLQSRYVPALRMFHNEAPPSPSYGATALAVGALARWDKKDWPETQSGLTWLRQQSLASVTSDLRGKPFRGYLRGRYHFELAGHALALRLAEDVTIYQAWRDKMQSVLAEQQEEAGGWEGWFGTAYGTALVVMALQPR